VDSDPENARPGITPSQQPALVRYARLARFLHPEGDAPGRQDEGELRGRKPIAGLRVRRVLHPVRTVALQPTGMNALLLADQARLELVRREAGASAARGTEPAGTVSSTPESPPSTAAAGTTSGISSAPHQPSSVCGSRWA